jgi:malate synthase
MAWDPRFLNPNIDVITMTYPYMRAYEDRVRRAVNTPDRNGRFALWQGGMEPNIPVGSADGVRRAMERAVAGAHREQQAGASGKWVAHWKMVHIVRPVWETAGETNQAGRRMPPLTYTAADAQALTHTEDAARSIRGARDLISVAMQYANAFGQGMQAAALKPADSFGDDDVLYLMEDMATAEIRVSILWEWLHKRARLAEADNADATADPFTPELFERLLAEEHSKLVSASNRDVHDDSKRTTLPVARLLVQAFVTSAGKLPWFVDLLNATLGVHDLNTAQARIESLRDTFLTQRVRVTANLDFDRDRLECSP